MKELRLVKPNPDRAYISSMLWLPKKLINIDVLKNALEYYIVKNGRPTKGRLWEETVHHLIIPREFLSIEQYPTFPFPFIDLTPKTFPQSHIHAKAAPRDDSEQKAYQAFRDSNGGTLNLACGKGKTTQTLIKVSELGCPSLIVVHTSYLMSQWEEEINKHLELPPGEKIGIIQAKKFDWQRPITLAMLTTLAMRARDGALPPEFPFHFGVVVYDEVHHLSAPLFVESATALRGLRYGLTATATRNDGMEYIFNYHLGKVFYTDLEQDLTPLLYFQRTPTCIDLSSDEVRDKRGEVSIPKIYTALGKQDSALFFRYQCIKEALSHDRKILCLSHSKDMLKALNELFTDSALIIGETPQAERTEMVRKSRLTFAIMKLGAEGLNDPQLDTLIILTPFRNDNDFQQTTGRTQRALKGKNKPIVIIMEDEKIKPLWFMCRGLKKSLKQKGIPYETLAPPVFK